MTSRFGCIGNCAIRNAESFSDEWSSANWRREQVEWKIRGPSVFALADIYMCGENASRILIDSSWRRRRRNGWSSRVLSQGDETYPLRHIRALPSPTTAVIVQLQFAKLSTASWRLFRHELREQARSWPQKGGRSTHNAF